jgi:hypothetical protein
MSAVSSILLGTLLYALRKECHFALADGFALSNLGSLLIARWVRNVLRTPRVTLSIGDQKLPRNSPVPH